MSSGFSGGGPEFYTTGGLTGRSMALNNPQGPYRSQIPGILTDPVSQILHRSPNLIGKRSLAEFQTQQHYHHHQQQQALGLYLRNVKQRTYLHASPIPPTILGNGNSTFVSPNLLTNRVVKQEESEKKMMNRLLELEKQLLDDDNDVEENDAVSVVTNSEWSETIQNLISVSETSSSSSSSSSSSPTLCPNQSFIEAATAISEGKIGVAAEILTRLNQVANSRGTSEQRLTAYMANALRRRVNPTEYYPELYSKEHVVSTQMLYEVSPCFKLGFMAANLAILEATSDQQSNSIHVVDFDIGQGKQYAHLIHALVRRKNSGNPTSLKITTFADFNGGGEERLNGVRDFLRAKANKVGVGFNFNVLSLKINDLSLKTLGVEPNEALAVNFAFKLFKLPDESVTTENLRDELLRRVKGLSPKLVTVVEQEMNTNTAPFVARVNDAFGYYGALFDSLDATMGRDNPDRVRVEEGLGRKVTNSVACEGRDRVERCEVFGKWRARMGMAGFEPKPLSQLVVDSLRAPLESGTRGKLGFTVKEESGGVCFGWMGRTLAVASAWR